MTRTIFGRLLAAFLLPVSIACEDTTPVEPAAEPDRFAFVFLADSSGKILGRLVEGGWPSWSSDGRRVVFERDGHVRVIDIDGTNERDLAKGRWPTWSPDGSRIAFASTAGISVMNADGSGARTLLSPALVALHDWGVGKPSWSPDGALIAFDEPGAYFEGATASVFVMNADGSSQYVLGYGRYESEPSWSPDGSRLAYYLSDIGLVIVPRGGGIPLPLSDVHSVTLLARPAWSPDGRAILFNGKKRDEPFQIDERSPASIMTVSPGAGARVLIDEGADAAWSPDGTRIAFVKRAAR